MERLETAVAATPTRVPLATLRPEAGVLDEERKLVTHAIRMATYNAESALAPLLAGHFPIDEARSPLREAFNVTAWRSRGARRHHRRPPSPALGTTTDPGAPSAVRAAERDADGLSGDC